MNIKQLKKQLVMAISSVLITAVALASSTYAWYINNSQVTATNVSVTSTTSYSLLIKRAVEGSVYSTSTPLNGGTTLVPVSTVGERQSGDATLADDSSVFKNDIQFVRCNEWDESGRVKTFTEIGKNSKTLINDGINEPYESTLYYADSVYLKAGQSSNIYFDNAATGMYNVSENTLTSFGDVSVPKEVALLKTMRVGLLVAQGENTNFFVYQFREDPIDITQENTYSTTIDTTDAHPVDGISYAAGTNGVGALSGVNNLINEKVPVITKCMADGNSQGLAVVYNDVETGKISQPLAHVSSNEEIKVDIYLWMEGCDFDNTAGNSEEFSTEIQGIQFGFCLGLSIS